jgi:hypothetical protein
VITPITHVKAAAASTFTTGAVDTSHASLLVVLLSYNAVPVLSDSKGNTWTPLTAQAGASGSSQLYYAANPIVGAGHTFTATGVNKFAVLSMAAFAGVVSLTPFDQQNGTALGAATTIQTGSITPLFSNELLIAGVAGDSGATAPTIDTSFVISDATAGSAGVNQMGGLAYLIETTIAAKNPTWTTTGANAESAVIASFRATNTGLFGIF